jgi:hypothetical protein
VRPGDGSTIPRSRRACRKVDTTIPRDARAATSAAQAPGRGLDGPTPASAAGALLQRLEEHEIDAVRVADRELALAVEGRVEILLKRTSGAPLGSPESRAPGWSGECGFLRFEGPLAEPGDPIVRVDLPPGEPSEAASPVVP